MSETVSTWYVWLYDESCFIRLKVIKENISTLILEGGKLFHKKTKHHCVASSADELQRIRIAYLKEELRAAKCRVKAASVRLRRARDASIPIYDE